MLRVNRTTHRNHRGPKRLHRNHRGNHSDRVHLLQRLHGPNSLHRHRAHRPNSLHRRLNGPNSHRAHRPNSLHRLRVHCPNSLNSASGGYRAELQRPNSLNRLRAHRLWAHRLNSSNNYRVHHRVNRKYLLLSLPIQPNQFIKGIDPTNFSNNFSNNFTMGKPG